MRVELRRGVVPKGKYTIHAIHDKMKREDGSYYGYAGFAGLVMMTTPGYVEAMARGKEKNHKVIISGHERFGVVFNVVSNPISVYDDLKDAIEKIDVIDVLNMPAIGCGLWKRERSELITCLSSIQSECLARVWIPDLDWSDIRPEDLVASSSDSDNSDSAYLSDTPGIMREARGTSLRKRRFPLRKNRKCYIDEKSPNRSPVAVKFWRPWEEDSEVALENSGFSLVLEGNDTQIPRVSVEDLGEDLDEDMRHCSNGLEVFEAGKGYGHLSLIGFSHEFENTVHFAVFEKLSLGSEMEQNQKAGKIHSEDSVVEDAPCCLGVGSEVEKSADLPDSKRARTGESITTVLREGISETISESMPAGKVRTSRGKKSFIASLAIRTVLRLVVSLVVCFYHPDSGFTLCAFAILFNFLGFVCEIDAIPKLSLILWVTQSLGAVPEIRFKGVESRKQMLFIQEVIKRWRESRTTEEDRKFLHACRTRFCFMNLVICSQKVLFLEGGASDWDYYLLYFQQEVYKINKNYFYWNNLG